MRFIYLLFCLGCLAGFSQAANWALLVAGSNSWMNYRHQADICHAYQILKARGFPEDHIVVFMYDDIANNPENPFPGKIINQPNGQDVYSGIKIDYRGKDVTPQNFLNALSGNKDALNNVGSGRVIESTKEDTVFVNFADHGGPGILAFPEELLAADDLEKTLKSMSDKNQFKQLLFYVEACEAGSMFDNILEENNKILVSTASARDESSYGYYCEESDIDTCLGDLYSIRWMEHMDTFGYKTNEENIFHQYDVVRTNVTQSHVQLYGDFSIGYNKIQEFFGPTTAEPKTVTAKPIKVGVREAVSSRDVPLHTATLKLLRAPAGMRSLRASQLTQLKQKRLLGDITMRTIIKSVLSNNEQLIEVVENSKYKLDKINYPCYKSLVQTFNQQCFNIAKNNYLLKHLYQFVNLCSLQSVTQEDIVKTMETICQPHHRAVTNMH